MAVNSDIDLDYHVTFPSPSQDEDGGERANTPNPENEPVVILLGWLGCQEKHLAKYSEMYTKKR